MKKSKITDRLVNTLSRHLLLDLSDMGTVMARKAHELIRDGTKLKGRSARGAEGQVRFRITEQGFQEICETYGGVLLQGALIEGSDLRIFQPFMRFTDASGQGVVLGLASMYERAELPSKNMSRNAGVELNYKISPRLSLDEHDPQPGDIFVLFLIARDPANAGQIDEIAIGIIDADYKSYLFYESIEKFMEYYAPSDRDLSAESGKPVEPLVKLKTKRGMFVPPELEDSEEVNKTVL